MGGPRVLDDGSLSVGPRLTIPADEIALRVTTSGGPGGQHANRSLTRVVASFRVADSTALSATQRARVQSVIGDVVRSSAGRFRQPGSESRGRAQPARREAR